MGSVTEGWCRHRQPVREDEEALIITWGGKGGTRFGRLVREIPNIWQRFQSAFKLLTIQGFVREAVLNGLSFGC